MTTTDTRTLVQPDTDRTAGAERTTGAHGLDAHVEEIERHIDALAGVLEALRGESAHLAAWGTKLAHRLHSGARALAAGNGGSAAEAQHLTAELVGRFDGERRAFSAISLHADTSSVTAIANDYGFDEVFARQVRGHGRAGDVLLLLSTSGRSRNLLNAATTARELGITTWALTGHAPNPLADAVDDAIALPGVSANVQEAQLVAVHAVCRAFDREIARLDGAVDSGATHAGHLGTDGSAAGTRGGAA